MYMQAHFYSQAQHIVGIEVNSYFSELQAGVVSKYGLCSRVKVVNDDVRHQAQLLHSADVIVMNNVFEFFCSLQEQAKWAWYYIKTYLSDNIDIVKKVAKKLSPDSLMQKKCVF